MRRDLAQPLDAGVLHGGVRVEAPGDGTGDERGAFLLKQIDQPLFLRHQRIDLRRLAVEEVGDGPLFVDRRDREEGRLGWHPHPGPNRVIPFRRNVELIPHASRGELASEKPAVEVLRRSDVRQVVSTEHIRQVFRPRRRELRCPSRIPNPW